MKLSWVIFTFLLTDFFGKSLVVQALASEKIPQSVETVEHTASSAVKPADESQPLSSDQAASLLPLNSISADSAINSVTGQFSSTTPSYKPVETAQAAESKPQSPLLPTAQSQESETPPAGIPVEFVLPSDAEAKITPELLPTPNFSLSDRENPPAMQFSVWASEQVLKANGRYAKIPQVVDPAQVPPLFTTLPLNGTLVSHLTQYQVDAGYEFGKGLNDNLLINGLHTLKSQVKQSISRDNVFTSDQTGLYLQAQTIPKRRTITVTRTDPQTVGGLQFQLSFTGSCAFSGRFTNTAPNAQCALTPAIATDRTSIDPATLQATRTVQLGSFGDVISPETLAILAQPGFQSTGANGEAVGLDLLFPNTGAVEGNSQSNQSSLSRYENLDDTYTMGIYRVHQVYKTNAEEAVLGRTIHGFTGIIGDPNFLINSAIQGGAELLPDLIPSLSGDPARAAVTTPNKSLLFAANNARLPERSFLIYQAGFGEAKHALDSDHQDPGATFNSVWLGLSPVSERLFSATSRYTITSPPRITEAVGAEGGAGSNVAPPLVVSLFNLGNTVKSVVSSDLSDFYTQSYITLFETGVNRQTVTRLTETATYYPHLSFTGNLTEPDKVLRYYTGIIFAPQTKAYLGVDYAHDLAKGLRVSATVIGYVNPDRDYFSKVEGRIEKVFQFSPSASLGLFSNFRYVLDQVTDSGTGLYTNPVDDSVACGIAVNLGLFSAGVTQYVDLLPSSVPTATGFNLGIRLGDHGSLSSYLIPQRNVMNYGVLATLKLNANPNAPTLSLSWNRSAFDFGSDPFGHALSFNEDKFQILFHFGEPGNPFFRSVQPALARSSDR